jgi:hypothetical protein
MKRACSLINWPRAAVVAACFAWFGWGHYENSKAAAAAKLAARTPSWHVPAPLAEGIDYSDEVRPYREPLEEWEEK